jgi:dsRNA-specific ribonuclease
MNKQQVEITIIKGKHDELKQFLYNLLHTYPELSKKNIDKILSDETMIEFKKAFTSPSAEPEPGQNYEFYELLGDSTANNCIVWYFQRRFFPKLENQHSDKSNMTPIAIMSRLKQEGASVRQFSKFSNYLGFLPYITMTNIEQNKPIKVLEDVFEAFLGCLVYHCDKIFGLHTGFTIVYPIIQKLFDRQDFSMEREKLYEPKSLLNEDITKLRKFNIKFEYVHIDNRGADIQNEKFITKAVLLNGTDNSIIIETPKFKGTTKQENEQKAAKFLLNLKEYKDMKQYYNIP